MCARARVGASDGRGEIRIVPGDTVRVCARVCERGRILLFRAKRIVVFQYEILIRSPFLFSGRASRVLPFLSLPVDLPDA